MPAASATDLVDKSANVSTGHLPPPELVTTLVTDAHGRFKSNAEGGNSKVYPALARVPSDLFGVCMVDTSGNVYAVGDAEYEFTIMSVSKPFLFALVCQELGVEEARQKIGVNATGRAFNSLEGIDRNPDGRTNPMVNWGRSPRRAWCRALPLMPNGSSFMRGCRGSPAAPCRSTTTCMSARRRQTTPTRALPGCSELWTNLEYTPPRRLICRRNSVP